MTTIEGAASARPSASRAAACSTVKARTQGAVAGPASALWLHPRPGPERLRKEPPLAAGVGDIEHCVNHTPEVRCVLGSRMPGALNTGPSSAHCSSVRSLE